MKVFIFVVSIFSAFTIASQSSNISWQTTFEAIDKFGNIGSGNTGVYGESTCDEIKFTSSTVNLGYIDPFQVEICLSFPTSKHEIVDPGNLELRYQILGSDWYCTTHTLSVQQVVDEPFLETHCSIRFTEGTSGGATVTFHSRELDSPDQSPFLIVYDNLFLINKQVVGNYFLSDFLSGGSNSLSAIFNSDGTCNMTQQYYDRSFDLKGSLFVDQDYCFRYVESGSLFVNAYNITMKGEAEIIVSSGNSLGIKDNVELINCPLEGYWKSITVESGATLNADGATFQGANSAIRIKDGGVAVINNCTFIDNFIGITVEEGGTLVVNGSTFTNCNTALENKSNQTIEFVGNTVLDCTNGINSIGNPTMTLEENTFANGSKGISFIGTPNVLSFNRNSFDNYQTGISLTSSQSSVNLTSTFGNENTFTNNRYGIFSNTDMWIQHSIFDNNNVAITSWFANDVRVWDCQIDESHIAVDGYKSMLNLKDNFIGINTPVNTGVNMILCEATQINSSIITAYKSAINSIAGVNIEITDNCQLTALGGGSNISGAAVKSFDDINFSVHNSLIESGGNMGGIFLNSSSPCTISNNYITMNDDFDSSGIRVHGGGQITINDNAISGVMDNAITFLNTHNNFITCNILNGGGSSLYVGSNSGPQDIKGNEMTAEREIYTRSILDPQFHRGNFFMDQVSSIIVGDGLGDLELEFSRFTVDPTINPLYLPAIDTDMVREGTAGTDDNFNCTGDVGPGINGEGGTSSFLCRYIIYLNDKKSENPKKYWINMYHIYRYYLKNVPSKNWSSCLKTLWTSEDFCGIKELAEAEVEIAHAIEHNEEQIRDEREDLYTHLANTDGFNKKLQDLRSLSIATRNYTEKSLLEIKQSLKKLVCTNEISIIYKRNLIKRVDFRLSNDGIVLNDRETLADASLCADEYGDAVHWARGILSASDDSRYDVNDNCFVSTDKRYVKSEVLDIVNLKIVPNPAVSQFSIEGLKGDEEYSILIANNGGFVIYNQRWISNDSGFHVVDISNWPNGIYFIEVTNKTSLSKTYEKLVVLH